VKKTNPQRPAVRETAIAIVEAVLASETATVKDRLNESLAAVEAPRDKALLTELAYGIIRRLRTLDWHIDRWASTGKVEPKLRTVLRLGAYQLLFLDKVPPYAAISESVAIAKKTSVKSAGFVNAVLRKIAAHKGIVAPGLFGDDRVAYLSVAYSFPHWLLERWRAFLSDHDLELFCAAMDERPAMTLRVNELKIPAAGFRALLDKEGVAFEDAGHPCALKAGVPVLTGALAELFDKGYFSVQDASTLRVVDLLGPQPGERVLDLCAAPGGKSTYCAQLMRNQGDVVSLDISEWRMASLAENARRLGASIVTPVIGDARRPAESLGAEGFDRILADVPCSNQGVMGKRVEARWRLSARDIDRLALLQGEILEAASGLLRPGGVLVYSTCSIDPAEDEAVVERFLSRRRGFSREKMFKTWPHSDKMDGAFAARLVRKQA